LDSTDEELNHKADQGPYGDLDHEGPDERGNRGWQRVVRHGRHRRHGEAGRDPGLSEEGIILLEKGGQKYKKAVPRSSARKKATPAPS